MIQRKRTLEQSGIFLKENPGKAHLTIDDLREMAENNNSAAFMSKVSRYVAYISGTKMPNKGTYLIKVSCSLLIVVV